MNSILPDRFHLDPHSDLLSETVLQTAEGTVKNHVSSILARFGVHDRTRAVLKALETGLLRAPDPAPP